MELSGYLLYVIGVAGEILPVADGRTKNRRT